MRVVAVLQHFKESTVVLGCPHKILFYMYFFDRFVHTNPQTCVAALPRRRDIPGHRAIQISD
jgi:hypothetical protein